ncbi:uncharacterized protein PODANS_5_10745 [Podospora anserina S mat+]|uniref:Podospora anserina S mat+ genomic DNA chromosome 5, supercontig 10 n=1 Tax=Podospora anserina (strain S / ATCC MYA-4624 / DSM 980 / FGSC 10383) TaxID=515849 RepID=B2APE7_PODAN|nr:uncharacterized protein PODANS_5_10745 [Podospora anserina S mat+]CAP65864.1 unnamed protein product [Podospora anserina S mat+]CDP30274.1 Putative protein of unknown function [Podospora anserina S mat+]
MCQVSPLATSHPPDCAASHVDLTVPARAGNAPPELSRVKGESGRFWEDKFVGYNIEAFFDPADPLKEKQAGKLWADKKQSRVAPADQNLVDHAWIKTMLAGTRRKESEKEMRETRGPAAGDYIDGNAEFATYYQKIKGKPTFTLTGTDLTRVKGIAAKPTNIRVP